MGARDSRPRHSVTNKKHLESEQERQRIIQKRIEENNLTLGQKDPFLLPAPRFESRKGLQIKNGKLSKYNDMHRVISIQSLVQQKQNKRKNEHFNKQLVTGKQGKTNFKLQPLTCVSQAQQQIGLKEIVLEDSDDDSSPKSPDAKSMSQLVSSERNEINFQQGVDAQNIIQKMKAYRNTNDKYCISDQKCLVSQTKKPHIHFEQISKIEKNTSFGQVSPEISTDSNPGPFQF